MTAFTIDDKMFREYAKDKIINTFLQKPIGIYDLLKEAVPNAFIRNAEKISFLVIRMLKSHNSKLEEQNSEKCSVRIN